jgi:hypothetical protein
MITTAHDRVWCVKGPSGRWMVGTLDRTRDGALFKLFVLMPKKFQSKYWKDFEGSKKAYKALFYKVSRVRISAL